jgi:hypothetical protein
MSCSHYYSLNTASHSGTQRNIAPLSFILVGFPENELAQNVNHLAPLQLLVLFLNFFQIDVLQSLLQ